MVAVSISLEDGETWGAGRSTWRHHRSLSGESPPTNTGLASAMRGVWALLGAT